MSNERKYGTEIAEFIKKNERLQESNYNIMKNYFSNHQDSIKGNNNESNNSNGK